MPKIVVVQDLDLSDEQVKRLKNLGDVKFYEHLPKSPEEWLERCKGYDIICSGKFGLRDKVYDLKDVFISLPFVGVGWANKERLKKNDIKIAYSPGCNKCSVSEWIVAMVLIMFRDLITFIRAKKLSKPEGKKPKFTKGLGGKKACILGKGNIGSRVGMFLETFGMDVTYFKKGDNLIKTVKDADVVIDCLSFNPTTVNILNKKFFSSLKKGSYFITVTGPKICDIDAMIKALDDGILAGAAHDSGGIQIGNINDPFYKKLLKHPKILVTPHISYNSDVAKESCNNAMIGNIEAWIKGKPINLVE